MVKSEAQISMQIVEVARALGFKATTQPPVRYDPSPRRRLLGRRPHHRVMRPDLVVEHEGRLVVVEVKGRQVLPGGVEQVLAYADALEAKGVICVPDEVIPTIAKSVARYASDTDVHICSISEVGDVLWHLLSHPPVDQ